ncbi:MAG TPA: ParB N-terminal domain-containing protein [Candidatus Limnocylindrales bacterium]|nr:ParB N-terminal domain-containing protein [Candidatus Limnocylindrales bacterium]
MSNITDSLESKFDIESALAARDKGLLKEWVIELLKSEGSYELAEKISSEKTAAIKMYNYPLTLLKKIQGPEENEIHRQSPQVWEDKVKKLAKKIENGFISAPLIVTDFWNYFEVADGNHRHEALERKGIKSYWTIFFIKHQAGVEYLKDIMKSK